MPAGAYRSGRGARTTATAFGLAGFIVAVDQVTKWLVRSEDASLPLELGWGFGLRLATNAGISFGRFTDARDVVLVAVALLCAVLVLAVALAPSRYRVGLGVLLGGAAGNLVDRLRFGAVIDFIDVPWWPTFNIADAAIVAGVALVMWAVLRDELT